MEKWLKPELIGSLLVGLATMAGTLLISWNAGSINAARQSDTVAELKLTLAEIKASISVLPQTGFRIEALEKWKGEAQGMFGSLDGRLRTQEDANSRNTTEIANIKSASGSKMR